MYKDEYNFIDTELENELHNLSNINNISRISNKKEIILNKPRFENINDLFDDIDLEEYDRIFEQPTTSQTKANKNKNNKNNINTNKNLSKFKHDSNQETNKIKIDPEETNKFFKEYEKRIEEEIEKELKETFNPLENVPESDKERANVLIKNSFLIRRAMENNSVTYEDLVFFIDYYELLALLDSKKITAVDTLQKISDLFVEDETWPKFQKNLEKTISETNLILENKLDMKSLLEKYEKEEISDREILESDTIKTEKSEKSVHSRIFIQDRQLNSSTDSNKIKMRVLSHNQTSTNFHNKKSYDPYKATFATATATTTKGVNKLTNSVSSKHSSDTIKSEASKKSERFELFSDKNKITNLYQKRDDRRSIIQGSLGKRLNSRPDLFKFNAGANKNGKNVDHDESELKTKFLELLELPKKLIENENYDYSKKNSLRRKIEDAVNFSKKNL